MLGTVRSNVDVQYLLGVLLRQVVLTRKAIGVHGVVLPLGRIDHEMMFRPVRERETLQQLPTTIERMATAGHVMLAGPRLRSLSDELYRHRVRRAHFQASLRLGDRVLIAALREREPRPHLVRPRKDLAVP